MEHRTLKSICGASLLLAAATASAQPTATVAVDLPVQWNADSDRQMNAAGSVSFDYAFASGRGSLFYDSRLDRFAGAEVARTLLHNVGITGSLPTGATVVEIGTSAFWRVNDGPWADAGFRGFSVVALAERTFAPVTLTGSYGAYLRRFPDVSALNQFEHQASVRALASFQSRTTITGALSLGGKLYEGGSIDPLFVVPASPGGRGVRRHGALVGLGTTNALPDMAQEGSSPFRTQWSWSARAAQSLDDRTGIWIEREERRTAGDPPPAVVWTPPLFYEDGVYDDPYAIEARTWRAGVKHAFARGDTVEVWAVRSARGYVGLEAEALPGVPRQDTLLRTGIDAVIPLQSSKAVGIDLTAGYGYVRNDSSDQFQQYRTHLARIGIQLAF